MKAEMPVQIDSAVGFIRPCDGDRPSQIVIFRVAVWDNDVQAVDRAALKYRDEYLVGCGTAACLRRRKLMKKFRRRRHQTETREPDAACFQKISSVHIAFPVL